jgi:hypothetical protein
MTTARNFNCGLLPVAPAALKNFHCAARKETGTGQPDSRLPLTFRLSFFCARFIR